MQGAEERRLRRMRNTPQGGAKEGNAADDDLMVDQGYVLMRLKQHSGCSGTVIAKGSSLSAISFIG